MFNTISGGLFRKIYELDNPIELWSVWDNEHIVVRFVYADFNPCCFDHGMPETMLFACDEHGEWLSASELWMSYDDSVSNDAGIVDFIQNGPESYEWSLTEPEEA